MLRKIQGTFFRDKKKENSMSEQYMNMEHILNDVKDVKMIQRGRLLQINNLHFQYHKKIAKEEDRMDKIIRDKNDTLAKHEHQVQAILSSILDRLKRIKYLKIRLQAVKKKLSRNEANEKDLVEAFKGRDLQVQVVHDLNVLHQI